MNEFFLVGLGFEMMIRSVGLLRQLFGMIDQALGERLKERQEVLAFDLECVIDKAIEMLITTERQMATKNDSIMATEHGYNGGRESFDKAVHGVLLPRVVW